MRTSHLAISKKIKNEKSKVTDEELFCSKEYQAYLMDMAEAVTKRYRRPLKVRTMWNLEPGAPIAYTDNRTITINCANHASSSFPSRRLRSLSLIGLLGHEAGHVIFTDFTLRATYLDTISSGRFYPKTPTVTGYIDATRLEELTETLKTGEELPLKVICKVAADFSNLLEDKYIEDSMCNAFPGIYREGIILNRIRMADTVPSIQVMVDQKFGSYAIIHNLILQYISDGEVNDMGGDTEGYVDALAECITVIDDAVCDESAKNRLDASNLLLVKLWKYVKDYIEQIREEQKRTGKSVDELLGGESESAGQIISGSAAPQGKGRPAKTSPSSGKATPSNGNDETKTELQEVIAQETARIALAKTDSFDEGSAGGVYRDNAYSGVGYERAGQDISRLLSSIAEERVNIQMEEELTQELQDEASKIRYGNAHRGIDVNIHRMPIVDERMVAQYNKVAPPLRLISKRLQRQISPVLLKRREGEKLTGLCNGHRLDMGHLYRQDGTVFRNQKLPSEDPQPMAVALLVDESGSMCGADRSTVARAASIVMYDFCHSLGVPIAIYGHTDDGDVEMYAYAEFESVDNKDQFRLMDISARSCNRDGAALRFVAERLMTRPEAQKLLILISDGQPNGSGGYSGTEAEADLRGITLEYSRKGIAFLAAAIGDDRPNIRRIYGDDCFLDITDLQSLPQNLTKQVMRRLRSA